MSAASIAVAAPRAASPLGLVLRAGVRDLARNRWLLAYGITLAGISELLFVFGGAGQQVMLSLLNATLLLVPLVALVFGTMHVYASREFIELLLAQPLPRRAIFIGLYLGLTLPLAAAFVLGVGIPLALHGTLTAAAPSALIALAAVGVLLTAIFAAMAMAIALGSDDRLKGMSLSLGAWFLFTIGYDGGVLAVVSLFGDWPLEKPLLLLMLGNPVDLARVLVLTGLDTAALLGYTGALFDKFLGSTGGLVLAIGALLVWVATPALLGLRSFRTKDF